MYIVIGVKQYMVELNPGASRGIASDRAGLKC